LEPAQPAADRYYELTFASGNLGSTGEVRINSRLHEQTWGEMMVANDYSFVGLSGFTDRMTIYVEGQLVWGVEPGIPVELPGTGGTSGVAGAANTAQGGATVVSSGGSGGTTTGSPLGGTSASTSTEPANSSAGNSGSAGLASYAGGAGEVSVHEQ
jgi:hypothetical protein